MILGHNTTAKNAASTNLTKDYVQGGEGEAKSKHSLGRSLDQNLDALALLYICKRALCVVELDLSCDELLHRDASTSDKINSRLVIARSVAE